MTSLRLLISFGISFLQGILLVSWLMRDMPASRSLWLFKVCLGAGIGFGISSLIYFLWRLLFGAVSPAYFAVELLILAVTLGVYLRKRPAAASQTEKLTESNEPLALRFGLPAIFCLAIAGSLIVFVITTLQFPHGSWDAWAIWNTSARLMYRGGDQWKNVFSNVLVHSDYPLLLGSGIARAWSYAGRERLVAQAVTALLFASALVGLLVLSVAHFRGRSVGLIAGLLLLSASAFLVLAPTQCADVPLAFFMLATVILLDFKDHETGSRRGILALAGLTAALATWTKNEGWLFLVVVVFVQFLALPLWKRNRLPVKDFGAFLAGCLPVLLVVLYYKFGLAPANDLVEGQGQLTLARLTDPARYLQIGEAFLAQLYRLDPKFSVPLILIPLFLAFFGVERSALSRSGWSAPILIAIVMLVGYFLVYLVSPHDLDWHLRTSLFRLFLQVWPLLVYGVSMIAWAQ